MAPMDSLIVLGKVVSAQGVRGELKVHSFTEPLENLLNYPDWVLRRDSERRSARLQGGRLHGKALVVRLEGVADRELAGSYAGFSICVPRQELPALAEGEFYWYQLLGLRVVDEQGRLLGCIDHLLETGANDVLVVKPCQGSIDQRERLLPYTPDCVRSVDLRGGEMRVEWDADF